MKITAKIIIFVIVCMHIYVNTSALACKYTVRDIGFTDLGSSPYKLLFLIDNFTPEELLDPFLHIAYASLLESNVRSETINIVQQPLHWASAWYLAQNQATAPLILLADSNGNKIPLPLKIQNENINQSFWEIIESTVTSPLREKIKEVMTETYGVVLLINGHNSENNRLALRSVEQAIKDISDVLAIMPKPIKEGPKIINLPWDEIQTERILLWSLGALSEDYSQPQVAVLFGRGRRIGPVLKAEEISQENVFSLLSIIGADCECGLDRSVMLGKMIPLRWDESVQSGLVQHLGFDVENPMVKAEMSQILSIQASNSANSANPLTAYKEGIVHFDSEPSTPTVSANQFRRTRSDRFLLYRVGMFVASGLIFFVLLFSGVIYLKSRRTQQ